MDEVRLSKKAVTLTRMAEEEFGQSNKFTQAEHKLLAAVATGDVAYCGPSDEDDDQHNDPARASNWKRNGHIDAKLIRWLCSERRAGSLVDPRGIQVHRARIIGELNLAYFLVPFPLELKKCSFDNNVNLESLEVSELNLQGSWMRSLKADGIRVKGDVTLAEKFHSDGEVRLLGAQIGGDLICSGGEFINPPQKDVLGTGDTLAADGISVKGSVFLDDGFRSHGEVRLIDAQIGGYLDCSGGEFINPPQKDVPGSGDTLSADGILVKGGILLSEGFRSTGAVRLLGAQIGGNLQCNQGEFVNPAKNGLKNSGDALSLDRATIVEEVFLNDGFRAEGRVSLAGTHIGDALDSRGGNFKKATFRLSEASAASVRDDGQSWPSPGNLNLNGFVYRLIEPRDAGTRLEWLKLQPDKPFFPQPYLQLARVLADAGDEDGRIQILVAMKDREWRLNRRGWMDLVLRGPFKATIGYGYRPLMAFWEVMGLSVLGWIIYRRSYLAGGVSPTEKDAYAEFKKSGRPPDHHPKFSPLIYSVENSLPLVKLEQADKWEPDPSPQTLHTVAPRLDNAAHWPRWLKWLQSTLSFLGLLSPEDATRPRSRASRIGTSSKFVRVFLWIQILLGWLLATLFLAGISGIIKKE